MVAKKSIDKVATKQKAVRGRPVTGEAKTSAQRGKAADDALKAAGGRILRARLSPEAAAALGELAKRTETEKEAIDSALIFAAKNIK